MPRWKRRRVPAESLALHAPEKEERHAAPWSSLPRRVALIQGLRAKPFTQTAIHGSATASCLQAKARVCPWAKSPRLFSKRATLMWTTSTWRWRQLTAQLIHPKETLDALKWKRSKERKILERTNCLMKPLPSGWKSLAMKPPTWITPGTLMRAQKSKPRLRRCSSVQTSLASTRLTFFKRQPMNQPQSPSLKAKTNQRNTTSTLPREKSFSQYSKEAQKIASKILANRSKRETT